jgi:hypothetical protein
MRKCGLIHALSASQGYVRTSDFRTVATLAGLDPDAVRDEIRKRGPLSRRRPCSHGMGNTSCINLKIMGQKTGPFWDAEGNLSSVVLLKNNAL